MDQSGISKEEILSEIHSRLSAHALDFSVSIDDEDFQEELAVCDDNLLSAYLEEGRHVSGDDIAELVRSRKLFPCCFGSALKNQGVTELIAVMEQYTRAAAYPEEFGAIVYKISRDNLGNRLTWMKITGGSLHPRDLVLDEKVDQIRLYSGEKFEPLREAEAGRIVALTGLSTTRAGQGLGISEGDNEGLLQPILSSSIILPEGTDTFKAYSNLLALSEEEPLLSVSKSEETGEITVRVMGEVQMEVLKHICKERFSLDIDYGPGTIVYKETIKSPVLGAGHFEPLRHYAEVHLLLAPGEPGSGLSFDCDCSTDVLAKNWQNLIISNLESFNVRGVLTGSEITDMKITVIGGRAHDKHTEGGDFREATMRAVRQGLMMAENILLEPVYSYEITLPQEFVGRALNDIQKMSGTSNPPDITPDGLTIITGKLPASELSDYPRQLLSYSHGQGQISLNLEGYEPCHNPEEVIENKAYDPDRDISQPTGSVFCSHGAGVLIPWDEAPSHMHFDPDRSEFSDKSENSGQYETDLTSYGDSLQSFRAGNLKSEEPLSFEERNKAYNATIQELDRIFERTYGPVKPRYDAKADEERKRKAAMEPSPKKYRAPKNYTPEDSYLLVDGYNVIHADPEFRALADRDMKAARDKLMDVLSNFQGYRKEQVILVFDAYRVPGGTEHVLRYHNLDVVFTKEAETADQYIERTAHKYSKSHRVTVATSDAIEQVIIYGAGAIRMSANDFWIEIRNTENSIREKLQ